MRFLLDTNILIPLEDSSLPLEESLARFVRLAHQNGHQLVFHAASIDDINRDSNVERRNRTLERLGQYTQLEGRQECPWNTAETSPNDSVDNEILYALANDAAHHLVTQDRKIHDKARARGLVHRVFTIQTADDFMRRLHEPTYIRLPNIEDAPLHTLTRLLDCEFFNSLRGSYDFDKWFSNKAKEGRKAWIYWGAPDQLGAICIYSRQDDEQVTDDGIVLEGAALKLCTFKVTESFQGRKIGELFLKAAFRFATANRLENIFIHGNAEKQYFLFRLLEEFGFERIGDFKGDTMYVKRHPVAPPDRPDLSAFDYLRSFYPHFIGNETVSKFIVPIQPAYHDILFPDFESPQQSLFGQSNTAGNAIKLAYLSHAPVASMNPGDVVLFYRSEDMRCITSMGVVEQYETLTDASQIASLVSRRTVYSMSDIATMAEKPTKVMLFRLVRHFKSPPDHGWLKKQGLVRGNIQSIRKIEHDKYKKIISAGG